MTYDNTEKALSIRPDPDPGSFNAAMLRTARQIERLHAALDTLTERLDPILLPADPPRAEDAEISSGLSSLANRAHAQADALARINDSIDRLIPRIDL